MKNPGRFLTVLFLIAALVLSAALPGCAGKNGEESREKESESSSLDTEPEKEDTESEEPSESPEETPSESIPPESEETSEDPAETEPPESTPEESSPEEGSSEGGGIRDALLSRYPKLFVVTAEKYLNVRERPSPDAPILGYIPRNGGGSILSMTEDGGWARIGSGKLEGYVSADFIVTGEEALNLAPNVFYRDEAGNILLQEAIKEGEEPTDTASSDAPETPGTNPEESSSDPEEPGPQEPAVTPGTNGIIVCIDAGHQQHGISDPEPNGPGSTVMKAKLTTGTAGCVTGAAEYQVNLDVSLKLEQELLNRGYSVVMIRRTNDCPMSNAERAQMANASGASCFIRVHCNSSVNSAAVGVMTYAPSPANPYLSQDLINSSNTLSAVVLEEAAKAAGAPATGLLQDDTMTGINWCQIPVTIVEMGFMSNPEEDVKLSDPAYQQLMAVGMANGIDRFFGR